MRARILVWVMLVGAQFFFIFPWTDPKDVAALTSFKYSSQNLPPNWRGSDPCGSHWEGIKCNNSRVTSLYASKPRIFRKAITLDRGAMGRYIMWAGLLRNPFWREIGCHKRANTESPHGAVQFKAEINLLSMVHHKNVVNLEGFCYEKHEQLLVYECISNGTLKYWLSGKSGIMLQWVRRLRVALDAATGLEYLHEHARHSIIHRDVKSDDILLDEHLNAKIAVFGTYLTSQP